MSVRGSKHIFIYYRPHLFWRWNYMFLNGAVFNHKEHLFWDQRAVLNYCLPFREFCIVCLHASCLGSALSTHLLSASDGFIWRGPAKLTGQMIFFFFPQIYTLRIITSAYVPRRWFTAKRRFMKHLSLRAENTNKHVTGVPFVWEWLACKWNRSCSSDRAERRRQAICMFSVKDGPHWFCCLRKEILWRGAVKQLKGFSVPHPSYLRCLFKEIMV